MLSMYKANKGVLLFSQVAQLEKMQDEVRGDLGNLLTGKYCSSIVSIH